MDWLKQYLHFSKKDRNAILTLAVLIFLGLIGHIIINKIQPVSKLDLAEVENTLAEWKKIKEQELSSQTLFNFDPNIISEKRLDSLAIPEAIKRNIVRYRLAGGKFRNIADVKKIYGMNDSIFAVIENYLVLPEEINNAKEVLKREEKLEKPLKGNFDPNVTNKDELERFGFNDYQADNLIKYRESGGSFDNPADLLKIYGVDSAFFLKIKENIHIDKQNHEHGILNLPITIIELNAADSIQLVNFRRIGPVFSSRIIKFRGLLGGFYAKSQLLEVYDFPTETYDNIVNNISVDTTLIKKIRINFADFKELLRHPYLKKEQVDDIIKFRENNGQFTSINQILEEGVLNKTEFERIKPYLTCR